MLRSKLAPVFVLLSALNACGPNDMRAAADADITSTESINVYAAVSNDFIVYGDTLNANLLDWSWATHNMAQKSVVQSGSNAISMVPTNWQGLNFVSSAGLDASAYSALDFWVYGASPGGEKLVVLLGIPSGTYGTAIAIETQINGGKVPSAKWTHVTIPLATLGVTTGKISAVVFQANSASSQPTVYIDNISLLAKASASPTPTPTHTPAPTPSVSPTPTPTHAGPAPTPIPGSLAVFNNGLQNGFTDGSWTTHDFAESSTVLNNPIAISMSPSNWSGVQFSRSTTLSVVGYAGIDLYVNGGTTGNQLLWVGIIDQSGVQNVVDMGKYLAGGILRANAWQHIYVPFTDLSTHLQGIESIYVMANTSATQPTVYLDQVVLAPAGSPAPQPTPTVTPAPVMSPTPWLSLDFVDNPGGVDPNAVALTFDDGPDGWSGSGGTNNTGYILDQLKALGVQATFFICDHVWTDVSIDPLAQADIQRMVSEGHDVGNHTMDHLNLSTITAAQVDAEFAQNANALAIPQALGPGFTMSMYRAPFGVPYEADTNDVLRVAPVTAKYGVHIGWGIESNDWDCANSGLDANCVINNVTYQLDHGHSGIILMHAPYRITGDALPSIVKAIKAHGKHIVSVESLIKAKYGATSAQLMHANAGASFSPDAVGTAAANACGLNNFNIYAPYPGN